MSFEKTYIPYGRYWSSPFCRWQGSIGSENSVKLVASTAARFLASKEIPPDRFDGLLLGFTVPQRHSFYGAPWVAGMIGATGITGPNVSQACATSARVLAMAAAEIETSQSTCLLGLTCDRTSNGPLMTYPNPKAVGGRPEVEEWVWDNFNRDPFAKNAMIQTAENVARKAGIERKEQDEATLVRSGQYQDALKNDRAFQRRYMFPIEIGRGKKVKTIEKDEGVFPTTEEGLARLQPVLGEEGTVTYGTQTYPADGNAGMIVCTEDRAKELAGGDKPTIRLLSAGQARVDKGFMPMAVIPAARNALAAAGIDFSDLRAAKTHNPFAVNDVYFARESGLAVDEINCYGSPLVYGHPQGPTGMRVVIELIEELAMAGGGYGLFAGCAAGDTAMALVVKVD